MLYLFTNPWPPGKKTLLTISSVLISSRETEAWVQEEGEKRKPECVSALGAHGSR